MTRGGACKVGRDGAPLPRRDRPYSRHLLLPEVTAAGSRASRPAASSSSAPGASARRRRCTSRPRASERSDSRTSTPWTSPTSRGRSSTKRPSRAPEAREGTRPPLRPQPPRRSRALSGATTRDNAMAMLGGYDVVLDGTDNFATRYLTNDARSFLGLPERLRLDLPVRGPGQPLPEREGAVLSLPLSLAARAGPRPELRRRRRSRRPPGRRRLAAGDGGAEAPPRDRPLARGAAPPLRRARALVPRDRALAGSRVPALRRRADDHGSRGLRRALRRRRSALPEGRS